MTTEEKALQIEQELQNIMEFATPEERAKLNILTLDGSKPTRCFYGQMTGNFESERGRFLRKKSASRTNEFTGATRLEFSTYPSMAKLVIPYLKGETDSITLEQIQQAIIES